MAFVGEPPQSEGARRLYEADLAEGYVANYNRVWAWRPELVEGLRALWMQAREDTSLEDRDFAVLVAATAAELGDSYCSLAWGGKLAALTSEETAAAVIRGRETALTDRDVALARWARRVVRDPNATTKDDVQALRDVGLGDKEILEVTAFVAFRLAFSTVNDALGAQPDSKLAEDAPEAVRRAVSYGRPPASN